MNKSRRNLGRRSFLFYAALFLLFASYMHAAEDFSTGMLDMDSVMLDAKDATLNAYPDADEVMLNDVIVTSYTPDGRSVSWDDTAIKVLTEKGRRENRVLTLYFNQTYSRESFEMLHVIDANGVKRVLDVKVLSRVMTDTGQMRSNIFDPNNKVLKLNIPGLTVGTVIRYLVRRETFKPRVPNTFSDYQVLEYDAPIMHMTIKVRAPKERPLANIALLSPVKDTVAYTKAENADGITHTWRVHGVPQAFPEPKMPKLYTCVQRLLMSTIADWRDVSRWYWNLSLPHLKSTPAIDAMTRKLCEGAKDDETRVRSIFRFVSQEIRYMGETTETEAPGYEPHDAAQTFEKRHGVCRDKAALLAVMLRAAGFQAFPVLISVGPLKDREVPQPYFNHAITAMLDSSGTYRLMDPTDENTADLFPAYLGHKSFLVARPEGDTLFTSPVVPAADNMLSVKTHCDIDAAGVMKGTASLSFKGINDNAYRSTFSMNTPDENKLFLQSVLKRVVPGARLTQFVISPENMMDTEARLAINMYFTADDFMGGDNNLAFFRFPLFSMKFGLANMILGDTSLNKRRFPFTCAFPCAGEETLTITVDPAWGVPASMPAFKEIRSETLDASMSASFAEDTLSVNRSFAIKTVEFSPEQYLELKKNLTAVRDNAMKMPVFNKKIPRSAAAKPIEPDTVILDQHSDFKLISPTEWTEKSYVKMQILTYKGKKDNSELKFSYFPHTESVALSYARVYNGAECQKLNLAENKLMDASWVASAPRYPTQKTLVANLPGVEIGSVIEYEYTMSSKGTQPFALLETFRTFSPINSKRISITAPSDLKLDIHLSQNGDFIKSNNVNITADKSENAGEVTRVWTTSNQPPLKYERNYPRLRFILPSLCVTTTDWTKLAATFLEMAELRSDAGNDVMRVADLVQNLDPLRKVEAIRNYVAKNIRAAGPSFTSLPFSDLTSAEKTLNDGYGHSADRAILLHALLRQAGLNPEIILVHAGRLSPQSSDGLRAFCDPYFFETALVRVKADGITVWLNDSDQYAHPGTCAYDGCLALGRGGKIFTIAVPKEFANRRSTSLHVNLFADGGARVISKTIYSGTEFTDIKRLITEQTPEERRRYHLKKLSDLSIAATADGALKTDVDSYPACVTFSAMIPDFAARQGELLHVSLHSPFPSLFQSGSDSRLVPYESNLNVRGTSEITIELPDEFQDVAFTPPTRKIRLPQSDSLLTLKSSIGSNTARYEFSYEIVPFMLSPADFLKLNKIVNELNRPDFARLILRNK